MGPFFLGPGDSHFYQCFNRNKRSVRLDLKSDAGRGVLRDLAASCEAVFGNLRGDQPEKLGLTYAQLRDRNPAIVCVHLSAYGRTGDRASWPGFDFLMQAEAGHLHLTGSPDGPPERYGISVVDYMTGLTAAFALVTGVLEARARGVGRDYDVSLLDVARYNLGYQAAWYLNEGYVPARLPRSAHASIVPCQLYRTADGWIFIMCNKEKFWGTLARAVGRPEWEHDPRFATFAARLEHRDLIADLLDDVLSEQTTATWLERFAGEVPAAPVNELPAALEEARADGRILAVDHPVRRGFEMMANAVRIEGEPHPARPAPALGADSDSVLAEIGYDPSRIAHLRGAGRHLNRGGGRRKPFGGFMNVRRTHVLSGSKFEELAGYARAVVVGDRIFVSGTVGVDFATGVMPETAEEQSNVALDTIERALEEAGSGLGDVVRVRVYVPDPDDVVAVSGVLKARCGAARPANTTVCAPLAVPGCRVEIEVDAIRGSG